MPLSDNQKTIQPVILQSAEGAALAYADKTAFMAAGWGVAFRDYDGNEITGVTWDIIPSGDVDDLYLLAFFAPTQPYSVSLIPPDDEVVVPAAFGGRGNLYTMDTIAGLIRTANGSFPMAVFTSSLTVYQDDSITVPVSINEAALTLVGATSLADLDDITAAIKLTATNATDAPDVDDPVVTIVTDTSGDRTLSIRRAAFPDQLDVPDGGASQRTSARLDVRISKQVGTGVTLTIIAAVVDLDVVWSANAGEASP
jgi:hypothetical protein